MSARDGLTLIELLVVMTLLALLVGIAVPRFWAAARRADAAAIISDIHTIRLAAVERWADEGSYPATADMGEVPPGLGPYLPDGFVFGYQGNRVVYRWRRWTLPGTTGEPTYMGGVQIRSEDAELMAAVRNLYRGPVSFGDQNRLVFLVRPDPTLFRRGTQLAPPSTR